jgi:pimeloyl-ACP methyl ester carboxylesterase
MEGFAQRGFEVHAISLRGHGASDRPASFNLCGVEAYLNDIEAALAQITPAPVVVAHSLGAYLMQHYLARRELPGVVLLCGLPHTGAFRFLSQWAWRHPGAALRTVATFNTRHLVGTAALAREAFFRPDLPEDTAAELAAQLSPEALRVAVEAMVRLPRPRPGRTPVFVVAAERDAVFTLAEQEALAAAWAAELAVIPAAAHDLMLDPAWPQAADQIARAAARWMA